MNGQRKHTGIVLPLTAYDVVGGLGAFGSFFFFSRGFLLSIAREAALEDSRDLVNSAYASDALYSALSLL